MYVCGKCCKNEHNSEALRSSYGCQFPFRPGYSVTTKHITGRYVTLLQLVLLPDQVTISTASFLLLHAVLHIDTSNQSIRSTKQCSDFYEDKLVLIQSDEILQLQFSSRETCHTFLLSRAFVTSYVT